VWWGIAILESQRQEDHKFKVNLEYIVKPCPKKTKQKQRKRKESDKSNEWWVKHIEVYFSYISRSLKVGTCGMGL
jgi:hypothetical protein